MGIGASKLPVWNRGGNHRTNMHRQHKIPTRTESKQSEDADKPLESQPRRSGQIHGEEMLMPDTIHQALKPFNKPSIAAVNNGNKEDNVWLLAVKTFCTKQTDAKKPPKTFDQN